MTEIDAVEQMWDSFIGNMNNHPLHMGAYEKCDAPIGDDDGRLWHFTKFSVLTKMLEGQQIWLSDLSFSNDEDEICHGLQRVNEHVKDIHAGWDRSYVRAVQQLAKRAKLRFKKERHAYAFSFSEERDTVQHWNGYGGGLHNTPDTDDPYVAIGFDATALAWPHELSPTDFPILLFSVATVDGHADRLADYWTVRALQTIERLEQKKSDAAQTKRVHDTLERMLAFTCALMKQPGWKSELECRLLLINKSFGGKDASALPRPDGKGHYVPLTWAADRMPIQAIAVHPLGQVSSVKRKLQSLRGGKNIEVIPSQLKPSRRVVP